MPQQVRKSELGTFTGLYFRNEKKTNTLHSGRRAKENGECGNKLRREHSASSLLSVTAYGQVTMAQLQKALAPEVLVRLFVDNVALRVLVSDERGKRGGGDSGDG